MSLVFTLEFLKVSAVFLKTCYANTHRNLQKPVFTKAGVRVTALEHWQTWFASSMGRSVCSVKKREDGFGLMLQLTVTTTLLLIFAHSYIHSGTCRQVHPMEAIKGMTHKIK